MGINWLFLGVTKAWDVAVPFDSVHRVIHVDEKDYGSHAERASSLAEALGVELDPSFPGALVQFQNSTCWKVGFASFLEEYRKAAYCVVPDWVFETSPPWCTAVLLAGDKWAFVASREFLEGSASD